MGLRLTLAALASAATLAGSPARARELTIATWGGALQRAQHEVFFLPFTAATGIALHETTWDGGLPALRAADGAWDVVQVEPGDLLAGCADGTFEKLDWSALGGQDRYLPQAVSECGVGAFVYAFVLAWDRDKFPGAPGWADFWDVAKYPGKRGLRRGAKMNLEIALMADGVAPGDVYRVLRTDDGVDRAFRKLEQLKPYLAWWQSTAQAVQLIASGEVLFSTAPNAKVTEANRADGKHLGLQWAGSLGTVDSWALPKGSPNEADAVKFLAFAGDPAVQARLLPLAAYGGTAKGAGDGLPPELAAVSPSTPANLAAGLVIDEAFWRENGDRLGQKYEAWLAR